MTEYVTDKQWCMCAKRIEKKNLKRHGKSLTFTGIARKANDFIIEIQEDCMIVRQGWREAMKTEVIS